MAQSVYADENSPEYKTCITCHMATTPGNPSNIAGGYTTDRGKNKEQVFDNRFVGANQAIPYFYGDEDMFQRVEQMLRSAAEIEIVDVKPTKEQLDFKVRVTNVGAVHNLPTGATDLRQLWLDIEVLNEKGEIIYTSGKLDENHEVDPNAVMFNSKFYDADGNLVTHHQVWRVTRKEDNLIPPKGSKFGRYSVPLDGDSKKYTIIAKLRYRVAPQYFADVVLRKFGGAGFDRTLPITDIDEVKQVISIE